MCYGEKCGLGRDIPQRGLSDLEEREGICQTLVIVFDFGRLCAGVTHPPPSPEGRFGCCFLVGNGGYGVVFPLLRGDEGVCYGERRGLG